MRENQLPGQFFEIGFMEKHNINTIVLSNSNTLLA